jgi:hypothetical protein
MLLSVVAQAARPWAYAAEAVLAGVDGVAGAGHLEMEFLDIKSTKVLSLFLRAIHSQSLLVADFTENRTPFSGFKKPLQKNPQNKKSQNYSWKVFCKTVKWG